MVIERPREYLRPAAQNAKVLSPELREVLHMLEVIEDKKAAKSTNND